MTKEQQRFVAKCVLSGFNTNQMFQIHQGLENGLSIEQVSLYAKKEFNYEQMEQIHDSFYDCSNHDGLSIEQVSVFAKKEFSDRQMMIIIDAFHKGLTIEQVSLFAKPELNWEQMKEIASNILNKTL